MPQWSRRKALAALATAGVAGRFPLLGCTATVQRTTARADADRLHSQLDAAYALLAAHLEVPEIWTRSRTTRTILIDSQKNSAAQNFSQWIKCSGRSAGLMHHLLLENPEPDQLVQETASFLRGISAAENAPGAPARLRRAKSIGTQAELPELSEATGALYQRSLKYGGSRIVYRTAFQEVVHDDCIGIRDDSKRSLHQLRSRQGVTMIAWTGDRIATSHVESGATSAPGALVLSDEELAATAGSALAHLHARGAPDQSSTVVILSAKSAALLCHECIAIPLLSGTLGHDSLEVGAKDLRISCTSGLKNGYGSYSFDDRGKRAKAIDLFSNGSFQPNAASPGGHHRMDNDARLRCVPSNVLLHPGKAGPDELIAGVQSGVLLDQPVDASYDPLTGLVTLLAGIGKEIRQGRLTGRVFARLLVRRPLRELLASTQALGSTTQTLFFNRNGIASSSTAPPWALQTRCEVL